MPILLGFFSFRFHKIQSNQLHVYPTLITTKTQKRSQQQAKATSYPWPSETEREPASGKHKLHKYPRLRLRQVSPVAERWICHLGTHTPPCVSHPGAAGPGNLPAPGTYRPLRSHHRGEAALDQKPPADPDPFPFSGWNHSGQDQTPLAGVVGAGTGPQPAPPPGRRTGIYRAR